MFRTSCVHHQGNHTYMKLLYGLFFMRLCMQSSRWEDVLDPLCCVLNYAFCKSIPIFSVETYIVKIFYPVESVPKINQKQQPSNTKLRQEVDVAVHRPAMRRCLKTQTQIFAL